MALRQVVHSMNTQLPHCIVYNDICYTFINLTGQPAIEVCEWISNFIVHFVAVYLLIHAGIKVHPGQYKVPQELSPALTSYSIYVFCCK